MIRVDVLFFAHARELAGAEREIVELPAGATTASLLATLLERHPSLGPVRSQLRLAVNRSYAPGDSALRDGDEVAVIPPVSGG